MHVSCCTSIILNLPEWRCRSLQIALGKRKGFDRTPQTCRRLGFGKKNLQLLEAECEALHTSKIPWPRKDGCRLGESCHLAETCRDLLPPCEFWPLEVNSVIFARVTRGKRRKNLDVPGDSTRFFLVSLTNRLDVSENSCLQLFGFQFVIEAEAPEEGRWRRWRPRWVKSSWQHRKLQPAFNARAITVCGLRLAWHKPQAFLRVFVDQAVDPQWFDQMAFSVQQLLHPLIILRWFLQLTPEEREAVSLLAFLGVPKSPRSTGSFCWMPKGLAQ